MKTGFEAFKLNRQLFNALDEMGYRIPTPVQEKVIPLIMAGQDVIGISQTGTGKTAAYLLPLIKMLGYAQGNDPRALIVLPTRELVLQVQENLMQLAKYTGIRSAAVYGATGSKKQSEEIEKGIDVIIGTPGRLLELYQKEELRFRQINYFILDEAERLMDISFIKQLYRILEVLPRKRKHYLFSATMSDLVKRIANDFIAFPNIVNIEPQQKTAATIEQLVYHVPNIRSKINLLQFLINKNAGNDYRIMVFCKTKKTADNLYKYFIRINGEEYCRVIHGNKSQQTRINAVKEFTAGLFKLLICTDVAARGIDVPDVTHVINIDLPLIYEDYVHRIGRTGRANKTGIAISMVSPADLYHLKKIEALIQRHIPEEIVPSGVDLEATSFEEQQEMAREIDRQKRIENPEFAGAFHQKKSKKNKAKPKRKNKSRFIS